MELTSTFVVIQHSAVWFHRKSKWCINYIINFLCCRCNACKNIHTFIIWPFSYHQNITDQRFIPNWEKPLFRARIHGGGTLHWRHNEHDGVSDHQPRDCLFNRLFMRRSRDTSKLRVTGLCVGNSPVTGEFPAQRASSAENVSIWWRHHGKWSITPRLANN